MKTASKKSPARPASRRLRIAFVIDDSLDSPNGVQQHTVSLGRWLARQGHRVTYLTSRSQRQDLKDVHSFARLLRLRFNGNFVGTPWHTDKRRLRSFMAERDFDILYVQTPYSPFFAGHVIRNAKPRARVCVSFLAMPQDRLTHWSVRLLRLLLWRSFGRIDYFIANTDNMADYFQRSWRLKDRPTIIPSTVDLRPFASEKKRAFRVPGKINVLFLGRLEERKGCADLMEAVELLPLELRRRLFLHIGGRGSLQVKIERQAAESSIKENIRLHGFITEEDKAAFLASADIAVFPSRAGESFGISLLEALAVRRAVVLAGRNFGYETILGERPDLMFQPANPRDLAACLEHWLEADAGRHAEILRWQRKRIGKYDLQNAVGPQLLETFAKLLPVV